MSKSENERLNCEIITRGMKSFFFFFSSGERAGAI